MKYDEIFESVNNIPIEDIFNRRGFDLKKVGCSYSLPSPFRKDSSNSSFTISPQKNIFTDWVLSQSGNATKFISLLDEISYFEAGFNIALDYGIIDENFYKTVINDKRKPKNIHIYEQKFNKVEKPISQIADISVLNEIYKLFISFSKLSDAHRTHLMEVRNLTEDEIKKFMFFTFPTRAILRNFLKTIESNYENQNILKGIPGFYKRKGDKNFTFLSSKGIGIPIFNEDGLIVGIQIRRDTIKEGEQRYIWFSSSFAIDNSNEEFDSGTSSGSPIDVVYPDNIIRRGVFITEGKFKAIQIAKTYGCVALSVQGVSTWKPIINLIKNVENIIKLKVNKWDIGRFYTAFDSDIACNYAVFKQLKNMSDKIKEELEIDVEYLFWDIMFGKGIDDLIIAGKADTIKNYKKVDFDQNYENLINKIIEVDEKITKESDILKNLSSDEFKAYFDKYFIYP